MNELSGIQPQTSNPDYNSEATEASNALTKVFDKYIVKNNDELYQLHTNGLLEGAFVITGDTKHVGIHKLFWIAQKIRCFFESLFGVNKNSKYDTNICHAMVVTGWDDKYNEKREKNNHRPVLAHSVMDGVKENAVDYFTYDDKDVDYMVVYVPKDKKLRDNLRKNAHTSATISSEKSNRSSFSWGNLLTSMFKKQVHNTPTEMMQKQLAYTITDLLQGNKMGEVGNDKKARKFYCIEYAMQIFQATILTTALNETDQISLLYDGENKLSRDEVAAKILNRLTDHKQDDALANAYWESKICTQLNPNGILSTLAAREFDTVSEDKKIENLRK